MVGFKEFGSVDTGSKSSDLLLAGSNPTHDTISCILPPMGQPIGYGYMLPVYWGSPLPSLSEHGPHITGVKRCLKISRLS